MKFHLPAALALFASSIVFAEETPPGAELEKRLKAAGEKGEAVETGESLAEEETEEPGGRMREIRLNPDDVSPEMVWSDKGDALFVAEKTGVIRRILIPSWREDRRLWAGSAVAAVAQSKMGIVALVPEKKEVWLLKEDTLQVLRKFPVAQADSLGTTPHGVTAFVGKGERGWNLELQVIDLEQNRITRECIALDFMKSQQKLATIRKHVSSLQLSMFQHPTGTPKGDTLLCESGDCLHRFVVKNFELVYEEAGPQVGKIGRIVVSADGVYVAVPAPEKPPADHPALKPYGTYVYKVKDLQKPAWSIPEVRVWGFTRAAEKVVGLQDPGTIGVFSTKGKLEKTLGLKEGTPAVRMVLLHESGKVLVLTAARVLWLVFD